MIGSHVTIRYSSTTGKRNTLGKGPKPPKIMREASGVLLEDSPSYWRVGGVRIKKQNVTEIVPTGGVSNVS